MATQPAARPRPAAAIPAPTTDDAAAVAASCAVCGAAPAVVAVRLRPDAAAAEAPTAKRPRVRCQRPLCLRDYYTSDAARCADPDRDVTVLDDEALARQLPAVQALFAEVFVALRQELAEEAATAASTPTSASPPDPLGLVRRLHKKAAKPFPTRPGPRPPAPPVNADDTGEGGFLRAAPLPDRLVRTQRAQAQKERALLQRMERASANGAEEESRPRVAPVSATKRRRPTRKSIWSVLEDASAREAPGGVPRPVQDRTAHLTATIGDEDAPGCTGCGGTDVACLSSTVHRNEGSTKGEIWGSGSRADVVARYQCRSCGRVWNETE